jgi:hypothetical protein
MGPHLPPREGRVHTAFLAAGSPQPLAAPGAPEAPLSGRDQYRDHRGDQGPVRLHRADRHDRRRAATSRTTVAAPRRSPDPGMSTCPTSSWTRACGRGRPVLAQRKPRSSRTGPRRYAWPPCPVPRCLLLPVCGLPRRSRSAGGRTPVISPGRCLLPVTRWYARPLISTPPQHRLAGPRGRGTWCQRQDAPRGGCMAARVHPVGLMPADAMGRSHPARPWAKGPPPHRLAACPGFRRAYAA